MTPEEILGKFVSGEVIAAVLKAAARCGAAAPAVPVKDTIKQAKGGSGNTAEAKVIAAFSQLLRHLQRAAEAVEHCLYVMHFLLELEMYLRFS